jgi:hypothetical protein
MDGSRVFDDSTGLEGAAAGARIEALPRRDLKVAISTISFGFEPYASSTDTIASLPSRRGRIAMIFRISSTSSREGKTMATFSRSIRLGSESLRPHTRLIGQPRIVGCRPLAWRAAGARYSTQGGLDRVRYGPRDTGSKCRHYQNGGGDQHDHAGVLADRLTTFAARKGPKPHIPRIRI